MKTITNFKTEKEKTDFVNECEKEFVNSVVDCAKKLSQNEKLRFITLSGPTCSGKTTAAKIFTKTLAELGKEVGVISIDDFYLERSKLIKNGKIDYDSVTTINLELLKKVIDDIDNDKATMVPVYSFIEGKVSGYREYKNPGITMFEGIQAVYPEIVSLFDKTETGSIYISVEDDVFVNSINVDSRTIRLFRRIVRDFDGRGANPEFTLHLWESVAENEDRSIIPNSVGCDYRINSYMGYELSMIKNHLLEILEKVPFDNEHKKYADGLMSIFDGIDSIKTEYLPKDSLYWEFVD